MHVALYARARRQMDVELMRPVWLDPGRHRNAPFGPVLQAVTNFLAMFDYPLEIPCTSPESHFRDFAKSFEAA